MIGPLAGLAADVAGTVAVGDRSEATLRSVPPGAPGTAQKKAALDLQTGPAADFRLTWPTVTFGLDYGLGIAAVDVTNDERPSDQKELLVSHTGQASVAWAAATRLRLTLAVSGTYGRRSYLALAPPVQFDKPPVAANMPPMTPPVVNYVPLTSSVLDIGALRTTLGASYEFDARWSGSASVYYDMSGGLNEASRLYAPLQHGYGVGLGLSHALTPTDNLNTSVAASETLVTTTGAEFMTLTVSEAWAHIWSERTGSAIGVGVVSQRYRPRQGWSFGTSVLPNAFAGVTHTVPLERGSTLVFTGATALGTGYNGVTGQLLYSVSAAASAAWTVDNFGLTGSLTASQSIRTRDSDPPLSRVFAASLVASYALSRLVVLQVGARESWQDVPDSTIGSFPPQWAVFASIGLRAPPIRF
jgi:hypothetical protein